MSVVIRFKRPCPMIVGYGVYGAGIECDKDTATGYRYCATHVQETQKNDPSERVLYSPVDEHSDGDGCATYNADYEVMVDGEMTPITDLQEGDVFGEYDDFWEVISITVVGPDDIHIELEKVEVEYEDDEEDDD